MEFWLLVMLEFVFTIVMWLLYVSFVRVERLWTSMWVSSQDAVEYSIRDFGRGLALTFFTVLCTVWVVAALVVVQVIVAQYSLPEALLVYIALRVIAEAGKAIFFPSDSKDDENQN